jgi:hypothetical protein
VIEILHNIRHLLVVDQFAGSFTPRLLEVACEAMVWLLLLASPDKLPRAINHRRLATLGVCLQGLGRG